MDVGDEASNTFKVRVLKYIFGFLQTVKEKHKKMVNRIGRYFDKFLKLLLLQYLLAHCKVLSSQIPELLSFKKLAKLLRSYSILNTPNYRGRCLMLLDGNSESKTVIIS